MRWRAVPIVWSLCVGLGLTAGSPPQAPIVLAPTDRPHFRSVVKLTTVTTTVIDASGHLVRNLPPDEFELFEDGEPQTITQFTSERVPVSVAILLDASDSMYGRRIADARAAVGYFVSDLLDSSDEFALLAFNHQQQLLTAWTDERARVLAILAPVRPWGSTAIYDAIMTAIPLAESRHRQRAALLVVSDGADTASDTGLRSLRTALLRSDLFIYAIGIDSPDRHAINAPVNAVTLGEITDQSGGQTHIVHDSSEVTAALAKVAEELNSQYLIGYSSSKAADGKYHSIRVRVRHGGYRVHAREMVMSPNSAVASHNTVAPVVARERPKQVTVSRVIRLVAWASAAAGFVLVQVVTAQRPAGGANDKAAKPSRTAPVERARRALEADQRALFASVDPLPITLKAGFKAIQRDRNPDSTQVFPATLIVSVPGSAEQRLEVRLRTRGHSRRNVLTCTFAPLRIEFVTNPRRTLFEGHKSIKLGTHCRDVDQYEQYVYREYTVYRLFNLLTPRSFRARLASATYVDTTNDKPITTRAGLLLEDDDDVARRLEGDIVDLPRMGFVNVDAATMNLLSMFEYMIGNTDVSLYKLHNIRLVRTGTGTVYPVPYDFDYSGLVNARYALPAKELGLATVRERFYMGPCRTLDQLEPTFLRMRETREQALALYDLVPQLDARYRKEARSYLADFYRLIEKPSDVKHTFVDGCRRATM